MPTSTPLDILHLVLSSTFAGVERYALDVSDALGELGHNITLCGNEEHFAARVEGSPVHFEPVRSVGDAMRYLVRQRGRFDIVHVHMTAAEVAATAVGPRLGTPIISTRHFAAPRGSSRVARAMAPVVRHRLAQQISISNFVASAIGEPSIVIPNGVRIPRGANGAAKVVLVTQRLDVEKCTIDALDAWQMARLADDGWRLRIVGEGKERAALEAEVRRRGLHGVEFVGHRADLDSIRDEGGIVLATAPAEPFGLAVAEAMAAGLPVVATRAGGHLETVGAVRPDLLYPPRDTRMCAAVLRRLAGDADQRRRIGGELRSFAAGALSIERHVERVEQVYESVARTAERAKRRRDDDGQLDVLRVYHGGVIDSWRERERQLQRHGCNVRLVSALRWNEGGSDVTLDPGDDDFVVGARTVGKHPYLFLFDPRPIARELKARRLDVIDVHEEPASLAALEIRVLRRMFQRHAPLVFYGAQNIEKRYPTPFRWIERGSLRSAAGAYCCNDDAAQIFRRKGLRGIDMTIGLGVDISRFTAGDIEHHDPFRLGYVGRIEERKGVRVLIEAMRVLSGVQLELHGEGPDRPELERLVRDLGLDDVVTFCGYTSDAALPAAYHRLDALAMPSLRTPTWVEQFGRVAVEAMAAGVPVLASDEGALREVIDDAGLLVPPGDVAAWQDAIRQLVSDPERRTELRKLGQDRALRYTWAEVARAQRALYDAVIR